MSAQLNVHPWLFPSPGSDPKDSGNIRVVLKYHPRCKCYTASIFDAAGNEMCVFTGENKPVFTFEDRTEEDQKQPDQNAPDWSSVNTAHD